MLYKGLYLKLFLFPAVLHSKAYPALHCIEPGVAWCAHRKGAKSHVRNPPISPSRADTDHARTSAANVVTQIVDGARVGGAHAGGAHAGIGHARNAVLVGEVGPK